VASIAESLLAHNRSSRTSESENTGRKHSVNPIVEAGPSGGTIGLSWQTKFQ